MNFWNKVANCSHKNLSPDYYVYISCPMSELGCEGEESHCLDCGVYISECGCGCSNGFSGWSNYKWKKFNKNKKGKVIKINDNDSRGSLGKG